jgi:hypothetical protein
MKLKIAIMTSAGVAAVLVSGCGGGGSSGSQTTGSTGGTGTSSAPATNVQSLSTLEILGQAEIKTESGSPYPVDSGALVLTDTSETSSPITVNGM